MNEKEIAEIRRRYRFDRSNINHIYGCFVNEKKEIISEFDQSLGSMSEDDAEGMLAILKKTLSGAIIALCSATLSMVAVMMLANLFVTPHYMHVTQAEVVALIPTLLLPFNAVKAVLNAALTLCLYKPISTVLKKSGFGREESIKSEATEGKQKVLRTVLVWCIGGAIAVAAFCVIFFVLGGKIAFN